jgi:hypothetical protein
LINIKHTTATSQPTTKQSRTSSLSIPSCTRISEW